LRKVATTIAPSVEVVLLAARTSGERFMSVVAANELLEAQGKLSGWNCYSAGGGLVLVQLGTSIAP
jgi:hypothetical protein